MAITLPSQCPTSVVYTPPEHPVGRFVSQSGATYRVLFGNLSSGASLQLEYQLNNEEGAEWMQSFEQARGTFIEVLINDADWGTSSIGGTVPSHIRWHFAEPPRLERIFQNRVRLSVSLTGDLEAG